MSELIQRNPNGIRKTHYVCFHCRKQFKKPSIKLVRLSKNFQPVASHSGLDKDIYDYPCPQCGLHLRMIGKNFRAPKQSDVEGWKIAERLLDASFSHDCRTGIVYPKKLAEVDDFVHRWHASEGEKLLKKWSSQ